MKQLLAFAASFSLAIFAACSVTTSGVDTDPFPDGGPFDDASTGPGQDGSTSPPTDSSTVPTGPTPVKWTAVPFSAAGSITGIASISPTNAYAITSSKLYHYDATAWTEQNIGNSGQPLSAIYAASATAIFVSASEPATMFLSNGTKWTKQDTGIGVTDTYSITGFGANDVWLGTQWNFYQTPLHQYDGTGWADVDVGDSEDGIFNLTGTSDNDLWGIHGTVVGHFDGSSWTDTNVAATTLSAQAKDNVFAVGKAGAIQHFDGQKWSASTSGTTHDLTSVWTNGPKSAWAAASGTLLRYDGASWISLEGVAGAPQSVNLVAGRTETEGWALGTTTSYQLSAQ